MTDGAWQRFKVYLGLGEGPDSQVPAADAEDADPVKRLLTAAPFLALIAVLTSLLHLAANLVFGGDTSLSHAALGALVFFAIALPMLLVCDAVARWWRSSGDPPDS
jgi:hypothetical protein